MVHLQGDRETNTTTAREETRNETAETAITRIGFYGRILAISLGIRPADRTQDGSQQRWFQKQAPKI